jgi:hypothetical protein
MRAISSLFAALFVAASARVEAPAPGGWLAGAQREIAAREYRVSRSAAGLQAPNRAHNLRTYFEPTGIRVHDRTAPGSPELLALRLAGVGRGGSLAPVEAGTIASEGARIEIRRPGLVEWYLNSPAGLEQGFTLAERPEGAGPLVLELAAAGAAATAEGDAIIFANSSGRRLRYGELRVSDAAGRAVAARFELPAAGRVQLVIEDAGAIYPVEIDPIFTEVADALLESNQVGAFLGGGALGGFGGEGTVAAAGDVNGDGYADVIVGAPVYDAGETDEGAAFVFLGTASGIPGGNPTTAAAQLESNQAGAWLGFGVAGAGDVNGDGYADVIVGAPVYHAGETNEGAAFVFLGSASGVQSGNPATAAAQLESNFPGGGLGYSVAGAGDVNGDGYADVIVGAPFYEAGQTGEGAAFVFLGSASGIPSGNPTTAATQLESNQDGAWVGFSVAGAGDVNGDGHADVIVGAPFYDAGQTGEGAAFVFLGSASGIPSGNPTAAGAQLESNQSNPFGGGLGWSVAGAGDVNGDGYADVIVGAPLYDADQTDEGAAFVFLGSAAGIASGNPTTAAAQLESNQGDAALGLSVAGAGDVNGDGYADVVVGAPFYDADETDEGAAFVFLGSGTGIAHGEPSTAAAQFESNQANARLGYNVAGAGDVNGDGYADVIVSAPVYAAGQMNEGAAFVYLGGAEGIRDGNPGTAATQIESNQSNVILGASVASAGDVNGDGYADVIVGAPFYDAGHDAEGAAFVFLGSAAGIADGSPATAAAQLEADQASAHLGTSVAGTGDVNGDGYADVIVGASGYDAGQTDEGAAFLFLGSAAGIGDGSPATAAAQLEADQPNALLGGHPAGLGASSVAGAGDVNGDGYADVIVGAYQYDAGQTDEGAAFLFLGSATGIADGSPASAAAEFQANQGSALLGWSVAGAGDVNGDSYADVIVGAPEYDAGQNNNNEGAAFLFLGSATGIADGSPASAAAEFQANQGSALLGWSVAGAGDVNGDSYADVIVGAPRYDSGENDEGAAFLFLGSAAGIVDGSPATAGAQLESDQAFAWLGQSVAGAGDVNGDGYADVIVGAERYDAGEPDEGAGFIFLGSAAGIADGNPATSAAQLEVNRTAHLGVAGAGDVNGDGYADVIAGAPMYSRGQIQEGAAFVFLGNGDGDGRLVLVRQLRGGDSTTPVQPWGSSEHADEFQVSLTATHPEGRGRVKLEVEACPAGVDFLGAGCVRRISPSWTDVTASGAGVTLTETITGLSPDLLYRWRARVLYASFGVTQPGVTAPPNPAHSPWRRLFGQSNEADLRTGASAAANLVTNGDFEAGNTGFITDYLLPLGSGQGYYGVYDSGENTGFFGAAPNDHTSGEGRMFLADGSTASNTLVWGQDVLVSPNTDYSFSMWAMTLALGRGGNNADLEVLINGTPLGPVFPTPFQIRSDWIEFKAPWNSGGASVAQIRIFERSLEPSGNDFGLDDLSLEPALDTDGDGIPNEIDTDDDGDGLDDAVESDTGTDPLDADSDDDGLSDGVEVLAVITDPNDPDHDDDTFCDGPGTGGGACTAGDNCPAVANAGQANNDALTAGDACQCGDLDADGTIDGADVRIAREHVVGATISAPSFDLDRCNVIGPRGAGGGDDCDVADVYVLRRLTAGETVVVQDACHAYTGP